MSDAALDTCPLTPSQQRRNLLLFATNVGISYLAAPVLYIGTTQANLIKQLPLPEKSIELAANLPTTVYYLSTIPPVLIAWYFCEVRVLKKVLIACQALIAVSVTAVALMLWVDPPPRFASLVMWGVVLQPALSGTSGTAAMALSWEALGRGASASKRGLALSLAFGAGPFLAFASSMFSNLLIAGNMSVPFFWFEKSAGLVKRTYEMTFDTWPFPGNYAVLYGIVAPMFMAAAFLSSAYVIPLPASEQPRRTLWDSVFGGIGNFVWIPVLRWAAICTMLAYAANLIVPNLSNNSLPAMGIPPEDCAGYQLAARFLAKGFAGFFFGWLVARSTAWSGMVATIGFFVASLAWALFARGDSYLFTFALFGAGELVGAYSVNYILSASAPAEYRRNMILAMLLYAPTAVFGPLFGLLADWVKARNEPLKEAGIISELVVLERAYQTTFAMCLVLLVAALLITVFILPRDPRPQTE